MSIATRVAEEVGCKVGDTVGYAVRFDFKCTANTKIRYYTDGVLLRETLVDPLLSKYSVIIVDEAHQRSLHSDILLGLLKKIKRKRPELRLIITSATLDAKLLKDFFESNPFSESQPEKDDTYILSIQGKQFPVDTYYLQEPCKNYLQTCKETILRIHQTEEPGDILVFLPGSEEIDSVIHLLEDEYTGNNSNTMYCLPLYSTLPLHQQMQVFEPTPPNLRKVILATNIAETSLTIEGIKYVVDSGFMKLNYFDVKTGIDALLTVPITQSTAIQRTGRAGRTWSGKSYRLMTEGMFESLPCYPLVEMQRMDISWVVLQLQALGIKDILHFDFLSSPSTSQMIYTLELLFSLGAIDERGQITTIGLQMAEMPIEPRLAKCILASVDYGCTEDMLSIAAMCSVEYAFITPRVHASQESKQKVQEDIESFLHMGSDHLTLLNIYRQFEEVDKSTKKNNTTPVKSWCDSHSLIYPILRRAKEIKKHLTQILVRYYPNKQQSILLASVGEDDKTLRKCLVTGYFAHVAKLSHDGQYHVLRGNIPVQIHYTSVMSKYGIPPEWILFHEVLHSKGITYIRELTKIDPMWLSDIASHYYNLRM